MWSLSSLENEFVETTFAVYNEDLKNIRSWIVENHPRLLKKKLIKFVPCYQDPFSRAECIGNAIESLAISDVFFVCDVDLMINAKTIRIVRQFSQEGRAFFPIFFRNGFKYS